MCVCFCRFARRIRDAPPVTARVAAGPPWWSRSRRLAATPIMAPRWAQWAARRRRRSTRPVTATALAPPRSRRPLLLPTPDRVSAQRHRPHLLLAHPGLPWLAGGGAGPAGEHPRRHLGHCAARRGPLCPGGHPGRRARRRCAVRRCTVLRPCTVWASTCLLVLPPPLTACPPHPHPLHTAPSSPAAPAPIQATSAAAHARRGLPATLVLAALAAVMAACV